MSQGVKGEPSGIYEVCSGEKSDVLNIQNSDESEFQDTKSTTNVYILPSTEGDELNNRSISIENKDEIDEENVEGGKKAKKSRKRKLYIGLFILNPILIIILILIIAVGLS